MQQKFMHFSRRQFVFLWPCGRVLAVRIQFRFLRRERVSARTWLAAYQPVTPLPPAVTRSLSALIRLHNTLMLVSCLSWQTEKLLLRKVSRTLPGKTLQCRKRKKIKKILISASSCACFFFLGYLRQCALKLYEPAPSSLSFYGQSPLAIC